MTLIAPIADHRFRHHRQAQLRDDDRQHDTRDHRPDQGQQPQAQPAKPAHHRQPLRRVVGAFGLAIALCGPGTTATSADPAIGDVFTGRAAIVDGDTIRIGKQSIRLFGIDTPERGEAGFAAATDSLRDLVGHHGVLCRTVDIDRYARAVALCRIIPPGATADSVGDGQDTLSEAMLRSCLARRLSRWNHRVPPAMRDRLDRATCP